MYLKTININMHPL